jgi:hypothetical protein
MGYAWPCLFVFGIYIAGPCLAILGAVLLYRAVGLWGTILGLPLTLVGAYLLLLTLVYASTITAAVVNRVTGLVLGRDDGLPHWRPRGGLEYAAVGVGLTGAVAGGLLGYHYGDGFWAILALPLGAAALLVILTSVGIVVVGVGGLVYRKTRAQPTTDGSGERNERPE